MSPKKKLNPDLWPLPIRHADASMFTTTQRKPNPFKASYDQTLKDLREELGHLEPTDAWLQLCLGRGEADLRKDGQLMARADVRSPGVSLTVVTPEHGTLVYTVDAFHVTWGSTPSWQVNLRAIALGLSDLRRLDRYGFASRGQQYAGFRELGAGTAVHGATQSRADVARYLAIMAGLDVDGDDAAAIFELQHNAEYVVLIYREASKRNHPDLGGSTAQQGYINTARDHLLDTM